MIAILQPLIPHYREEFFKGLSKANKLEIYCYESQNALEKENFSNANLETSQILSYYFGPFFFYNPIPFLKKKNTYLVLMLDFKHITTWFLLLTQFIHRKKIILWGQGISIKRYLQQEKKTFLPLKWMLKLAYGVWFYTEKEMNIWKNRIPNVKVVSLNNTISNVNQILKLPKLTDIEKNELKQKYNIKQKIIFIYCARFTENRRIDLMLEVIEKLDFEKYGFIIIGEGDFKPSFEKYKNVYDFGKVYDFQTKNELFKISDIYFQPAWLGLSVVEAMAYGLPVFSFERSAKVLQCVEYYYVKDGYNGRIFKNNIDFEKTLNNLDEKLLVEMGYNAHKFVTQNLLIENMINKANSIL